MLKVYFFDNYEDMCRKAAVIMAAQITIKQDSVLGLATGSTPVGVYEFLSKWCAQGYIDFSKIKAVNLDEYCELAPEHEQSYRYFMNKYLFDNINIDMANTYVPNGLAKDTKKESERYDKIIESLGGIDFQLLGIGRNGHVGFNEPSDCFSCGTHCETLTKDTIKANAIYFEDISQVPKTAITMGMREIMNAKQVLMVANGDAKKDVIDKVINGKVTPKVPASILQLHPNATILFSKT